MKQCKVSVVMPAKNAAETIADSIDSILAQELTEFELVIVDDGSIDLTSEIVQQYVKRDKRILFVPAQGQGIVAALNTGLRLAKTDYIARMDADDIMLPQRLFLQYQYLLEHSETSLVATQAEVISQQDIKAGYREYMQWQNACLSHAEICDDIFLESPFAHPSVMFRNSVVQALGGYQEGDFPEDYQLWLRMHQHGCQFHKLTKVLLKWRDSATRTSRVDLRYARSAFDRLRAQYLVKDNRIINTRPVVVWGAGRKTRQRATHAIALGLRVSMWIDVDQRKIGNRIEQAWVRSPQALVFFKDGKKNGSSHEANSKPIVLCYVNNHGARKLIADKLVEFDYTKGRDFFMVG